MASTLTTGLMGLWAGLVLGGSLIAAPAKFQAASLTRSVALDVGQHQFFWIGIAEMVLCAALIITVIIVDRSLLRWVLVPAAILIVQRLIIMPPLNARTVEIIAGNSVGPSSLHLVFIVLEVIKVLLLAGLAIGGLKLVRG